MFKIVWLAYTADIFQKYFIRCFTGPLAFIQYFPNVWWAVLFLTTGRIVGVVYDDSNQWLLGSCVKLDRIAPVFWWWKIQFETKNSRRNGKIDLPCISVWSGTGLYFCCQIVACPSNKIHEDMMSATLSEFMLIAFVCSASLCIRLRSILRNRFVTSLLSTHVL